MGRSPRRSVSLLKDLQAEPAVFVDFEHINRDMRRIEAADPVERFTPTRFRLERETGDEVEIEVVESRCPESRDVGEYRPGAMLTPRLRQFAFHERLHAETDSIDSCVAPRRGFFRGDSAGCGLDRSLGPPRPWKGKQDFPESGRLHGTWRSAAEVHGVGLPLPDVRGDLAEKRPSILQFHRSWLHVGGEVAIRALLCTERITDIDARHSEPL